MNTSRLTRSLQTHEKLVVLRGLHRAVLGEALYDLDGREKLGFRHVGVREVDAVGTSARSRLYRHRYAPTIAAAANSAGAFENGGLHWDSALLLATTSRKRLGRPQPSTTATERPRSRHEILAYLGVKFARNGRVGREAVRSSKFSSRNVNMHRDPRTALALCCCVPETMLLAVAVELGVQRRPRRRAALTWPGI